MAGSFAAIAFSKRRELGVDRRRLEVDLGRGAPDHDAAGAAVLLHEPADVLAERLAELALVRRLLHVRPVEAAHVLGREHRRHRLHRLERLPEPVDEVLLEHVGVAGGLVGVVGEDVPRAEARGRRASRAARAP